MPWIARGVCLLLVVSLGAAPVAAKSREKEYRVKAEMLYRFAKRVEWPKDAFEDTKKKRAPLVIGVLGEDPFGNLLDRFANRSVGERRLEIRRVKGPVEGRRCHILFVSASKQKSFDAILKMLAGEPVFTISEVEGFAYKGGVFNFYLHEGKVHFEANHEAAKRARLVIDPKLLALARAVEEKGGGK